MAEESEFLRAYFIQTRQEIAADERERDRILHLVIIVLGALGFAAIHGAQAQALAASPWWLAIEASVLAVIAALFWLRRHKLHQMADRWFVLRHVLQTNELAVFPEHSVEAVVAPGLQAMRYAREDVWLNWAVSLPVHALVGATLIQLGYGGGYVAVVVAGAVVWHWATANLLLGKSFDRPRCLRPHPAAEPPARV